MTKYIGAQPATSFEAVKKDRFTGLTGTGVTLSHSVNSVQDIVVWVNNVKQDYNNYTVSNTALTLGGSLVSADVVQILYVGRTFQTVNPAADSVGPSQVADTLISGQTALGATPADTDELLISDAGTLKRVDFSHLKSANTPAFEARNASAQTLSANTATLMQFDTEVFDTDGTYTNSSTFKFTPAVSGKYFIYSSVAFDNMDNSEGVIIYLYKNGSNISLAGNSVLSVNFQADGSNVLQSWLTAIVDSDADDYFQIYAKQGDDTSNPTRAEYGNIFMAYKLIT